jgi:sialic acid synthase SpsE
MEKITIDKRTIGGDEPCFIVAEAGINHNGNVDIAKKMIDAAKKIGVDAIKFQTYRTGDFISNPRQIYTYRSQGKTVTESMFKMFKRYEFNKKEWKEIVNYCGKNRITFFSTPQNPSDLDFLLEIIDLPIIKVGSDDLTNLELLRYYGSKNKPMIISAGMAFMSEIEDAVTAIKETGNNDLIVLHCVSSYPVEPSEINLRKMLTIKQAFDVIIGFSDHAEGAVASLAAVALGAKVIEKHFTLDRNLAGPDHYFSANPREFTGLIKNIRYLEKAMGTYEIKPTAKEMEMRDIARRSIVAAKDIARGSIITRSTIQYKRPGLGLAPKFVGTILNKKARRNIKKDELITPEKIL